ncbi:MAG TPA: SDR family oxidoreductase [Polyangiales bacterium]|nr:SDR family oxidoreductase [Polyangiales bacterium]
MPTELRDILECTRILESLIEDRSALAALDPELRKRLLIAAGRVSQPERAERRVLSRALGKQKQKAQRAALEAQLERTGLRRLRQLAPLVSPGPELLAAAGGGERQAEEPPASSGEPLPPGARVCYVCKTERERLHFFYDQLCEACGDFNYQKRTQTADLRGRVAYLSGGRVKIGYQAGLMLLRAGARLIVSTRFPRDAAQRYAREPDFESFADRLQIYGLDLRHTPSVEAFAAHLSRSYERLDFVVHNACQTVRRPSGWYRHLMDAELAPHAELPAAVSGMLSEYEALRGNLPPGLLAEAGRSAQPLAAHGAAPVGLHAAPELSQLALLAEDLERGPQLFPEGRLDADLQQVDLRTTNSWRLTLDQVSTIELLEVQLVNSIAPFVLNARLKPLLLRTSNADKHIVNVSAMEGQFYRRFKTDRHPHTNMAKAALNMLTRTSAADYVRYGIHMNSVDTGWITDEDPLHEAQRKIEENGFSPPLDAVDGAARILDPIFDGVNSGRHVWGQFLKDYRPAPW